MAVVYPSPVPSNGRKHCFLWGSTVAVRGSVSRCYGLWEGTTFFPRKGRQTPGTWPEDSSRASLSHLHGHFLNTKHLDPRFPRGGGGGVSRTCAGTLFVPQRRWTHAVVNASEDFFCVFASGATPTQRDSCLPAPHTHATPSFPRHSVALSFSLEMHVHTSRRKNPSWVWTRMKHSVWEGTRAHARSEKTRGNGS